MRSTVLALALVLLGTGGAAQAATISQGSYSEGHEIVVMSGNEAEGFYTYVDGTYHVFGRDAGGAALTPGGGCQRYANDQVACPMLGTLRRVRFDGGDGNDKMSFDAITVPLLGTGGPGDDSINNGTKPGDVDGGPGHDYINVGQGGGVIKGGDGDDYLAVPSQTAGPDDIHGGAGSDGVDFGNAPAAVTVTLDDAGGDGIGQQQNVHSDVDYVVGSRFDDRLVGNGGDNDLYGREGNDTLIGSGGSDLARGEGGNDRIDLADDIAEKAECGAGNDEAIVDAVDTQSECERVTLRATDADGDGHYRPLDCNDANPVVNPGARDVPGNGADEDCSGADAPLTDRDGDGVTNATDCDDNDPARHPGKGDIPKDGIDQDCTGSDADYPLVFADINARFVPGARTRVARLVVDKAPANSRVEVRCRGRGCPFARESFKPRKGRVSLTRRFRRSLSPGAVLEVRVLVPRSIGKVRRTTMRRNRSPKREDLCLRPGARRPHTC